MPRGPATFKHATVVRAIKPALALGLTVSGYKVDPDGSVIVYTASSGEGAADAALEAWKRGNASRQD